MRDHDDVCLSHSVTAVLRLRVLVRVLAHVGFGSVRNAMTALTLEQPPAHPVRVIDNNSVRSCEVDAETARTSTQEKHERIGVWAWKVDLCRNSKRYPSITIRE